MGENGGCTSPVITLKYQNNLASTLKYHIPEMELLWMLGYLILGVITILFIALYFYTTSVMVRPDECTAATGVYGVIPAATGTTSYICGPEGTEACTFTEVSLESAVARCEELGPLICGAFSYNEKVGEMMVVVPEVIPQPGTNTNLYRRRVLPITGKSRSMGM